MPAGGYQKPSHPAAVSGPGALSQRTDGGATQAGQDIPNAHYGENKDFRSIEAGAALAGNAGSTPPPLTPLDAPTARPDEPVTAGAAVGPGPGPADAGIAPSMDAADFQNMKGLIPGLELIANLPQSNPSLRSFVRKLKSLGSQ